MRFGYTERAHIKLRKDFLMPMQKRKKGDKEWIDRETRNAFRLTQHAAKLCGDEISGNLHDLPITIHYEPSLKVKPRVIESHFSLVQYALELLWELGFSSDAALHIVYDKKAMSDVMKDIHARV